MISLIMVSILWLIITYLVFKYLDKDSEAQKLKSVISSHLRTLKQMNASQLEKKFIADIEFYQAEEYFRSIDKDNKNPKQKEWVKK